MTGRTRIRQLQPGEPVPSGEPRRYRNAVGYIRLRWRLGKGEYVEAYEHRIVAGMDAPNVHHVNHVKSDNTPENLLPLSTLDHGAFHAHFDIAEASELYRAGWSLPRLAAHYHVHFVSVMRALKRRGVVMRSSGEWKLIRLDPDLVRELFAAGLGQKRIAAMLQCSSTPVQRVFRELGLRRSCGRVPKAQLLELELGRVRVIGTNGDDRRGIRFQDRTGA